MIRWSRPAASDAERQRRARFTRWMEVYWSSAQAWWELYETETAMYKTEHPRPTLKAYMIGTRGLPR